ncbi:MAG TPA: response regulator [Polyangiaceae bacterium]
MSARILVVDDSPTIRKVVSSILTARDYEALLAEDGQAAMELLGHEKVDLVLLDFVMPRMNGYQFCRELRAHAELKTLPVVLMSAKGDKIRGQFVDQTGAIDAITKPFDARGLVAVVEGALKRQEEGRAGPVPDAASMPVDEALLENLRPSRTNFSDDPVLRKVQAAQELAGAIERVVRLELRRQKQLPESAEEIVKTAIERAIRPETLPALATLIRSLSYGDAREVLSGDVSVISIAEVLQLLDLQRQSGALNVFTSDAEITLFIRNGRVDFAAQRGLRHEFLLGRYLVEDGAIGKDKLKSAIERRSGPKRLLGEMLVQASLVSNEAVRKALVRQTSELVYEVVRWKNGRFVFNVGQENQAATKAALAMETSTLVMEGFRRVDEWRMIEGSFDFDDVLFPDPTAIERVDQSHLTREERNVLSSIDGEKTIRELVNVMPGSSFEVCKILYQLLNSRLVRRKAAA